MSVATLANSAITVERRTTATDFDAAQTLTVVYSGRARVQPIRGTGNLMYQSDLEKIDARAYIDGTPDILGNDTMFVKPDRGPSETYIVRAARNIDHIGMFMTCDLELQK